MKIKLPFYLKFVVILIGIMLLVVVMRETKAILIPLLISGVLAIMISPLTGFLQRIKVPKVLAVILSVITLIGIISGLVYFFYNQILGFAGDVHLLEKRITHYLEIINQFVEANFEGAVPVSIESIQQNLFQYIYQNINTLTMGVINTVGTLAVILIMPIYVFLFLYFRNFLVAFALMLFDPIYKPKVQNAIFKIKQVVHNYITGMFIVICVLFVLNSIALVSLGIGHAFLFAGIAAMFNLIPFLGPFIGATLPILYAFLTKDTLLYPIGVFSAFYVIQILENNLFTPRIVGSKVSMNPLLTILALLIGNFIWGLAGMVLFIPGMAILKVIFDEMEGMEAYVFLLGKTKEPDEAGAKGNRKSLLDRFKQWKNSSKK